MQHNTLGRTILHHLSIQQKQRTKAHCTKQESCRVAAINEARRSRYNDQKGMNQLNIRNIQIPEILDDGDVSQ